MVLIKVLNALKLLIPFCYIAVGCMLLTDLFTAIDSWKRIPFGIIVILYGAFRIYNTKMRDRS